MILIIENNINISNNFESLLKEYDINFFIARSGVEAYKYLCDDKYTFNYIISNIGLPDENGAEIIKFAKNKNKKVIAIVYSGKRYKLNKKKYKYDYFFNKSKFSPENIIDMILNNKLN
jgi:DNA-binding NtrC family response regulator